MAAEAADFAERYWDRERPKRGHTGWLGRLDWNQGMAESKSASLDAKDPKLSLPCPQSYPRPSLSIFVLVDEPDAGLLEGTADGLIIDPGELSLAVVQFGAADGGDAEA